MTYLIHIYPHGAWIRFYDIRSTLGHELTQPTSRYFLEDCINVGGHDARRGSVAP